MRPTALLLSVVFLLSLPGTGHADDAVQVTLAAGNGGGVEAEATIRIHASREVVWAVLSSCTEALKIVPGLKECDVRERAADKSWARIWQVMDYSWFLPRVRVEVKASYLRPATMSFERVGGDPVTLHGQWSLKSDGDDTIAHYNFVFAPGFWVPNWIMRAALKRDLPRMLQALRSSAESTSPENLG